MRFAHHCPAWSYIVACAVLSAGAASAAPATGGLRFTIAVTSFENHAKYAGPITLADTWGACLVDALQRSGRFIVLGEADMRTAALAEQDFAHGGRAAQGDKTPALRAMTPAQLLIKGEITHFQDGTQGGSGGIGIGGFNLGLRKSVSEINAVLYVVDASTGQVVASKKVTGRAQSSELSLSAAERNLSQNLDAFKSTNVGKAMEQAIDEAVAFLGGQVGSLPWSGSVILARDGRVIINRGAREGVAAGTVFRVGLAEVLRDPGTGEVLDVSFTEKARIRVVATKEKISICALISGDAPEAGMDVNPL